MAAVPGIVFDPVEPPNPYLDSSTWLPLSSVPDSYIGLSVTSIFPPPPRPRITEVSPQPSDGPLQQDQKRQQALLPPFSVSLDISITQGMAKAVVTQTFRNDAPVNIEKGTYQFPLPHESSIVDFRCQIGATKSLQGQVKPRSEASLDFNKAVNEGFSAGLVEQDTAEIFRAEVGNIPSHTTVEVKLSFIFFLKYSLDDTDTTTMLTIPTYIAPRYGNPGFDLGHTGPQTNTRLSVNIDILNATEICDVRSDTHRIKVEQGVCKRRYQRWADFVSADTLPPQSTSASVKLDGDVHCLDRDFVLVILAYPPVDKELPQASLETHPSSEKSTAMMLEIPPSFLLREQTPIKDPEIVFLADRSGSMADKLLGLKSSMQFFLRGLPPSRFNLYCFGSNHTSLWRTSQPYGDDTMEKALHYVSGFTNDMGGTDLLPALKTVIASRGQGYLDVIVLTDGEVWQLQETIEFVRNTRTQSKGAVRFFALGIGNSVSHDLVEGIAKAGGGYAEVIPTASSNSWEAHMVAVLKAAMSGHIADFAIEVEGVDVFRQGDTVTPHSMQVSPRDPSSLSPFLRNRIFILSEEYQLSSQSKIRIRRKSADGQEVVDCVPVHALLERDSTIHKFAARALLSDLHRDESPFQHNTRSPQGRSDKHEWVRKEGERLGCQHSLVSRWTSFVAVETVNEHGTQEGSSERRVHVSGTSTDQTSQVDWDDFLCSRRTVPAKAHVWRGVRSASQPLFDIPSASHRTAPYDPSGLFRDRDLRDVRRLRIDPAANGHSHNFHLEPDNSEEMSQFLRRILQFQQFGGGFKIPEDEAEKHLGSEAHSHVLSLVREGAEFDLAVTIVIMTLLEVNYPQGKSVWMRVVRRPGSTSRRISVMKTHS
ncbi:von Willebrand factor type A domain-containing protein [Aspergillus egyptiacus]|nr:von Willebrand factor type A domain-containing protein [Aspergillus egyptiacus]